MRALLFVVAFVIGVLLTAPLERWLLPLLQGPLAAAGAELRMDRLRFALPAGLRGSGIGLSTADGGIDIDSLYVGITRAFDAQACGGHVRGRFGRESLELDLAGVDPSRCLRVGKLALEGTLDGSFSVDGIDLRTIATAAPGSVRIDLTSSGGVFSGVLEHAGEGGADLPLGEWEFSELVLRGKLADGEVAIDDGHALTSGVRWELVSVHLPSDDPKGLRIDFRARQVEDSPRARALLGLMPKAAEGADRWRRYRVVGTLAAPRVVGLE